MIGTAGLPRRAVRHAGEVNARWTATERRSSQRQCKSDHLDARAMALGILREAALSAVDADDETAVRALLTGERDNASAASPRLRRQLHQRLGQLDPEYAARLPKLHTQAVLRAPDDNATAGPRALQRDIPRAIWRCWQEYPPTGENVTATALAA